MDKKEKINFLKELIEFAATRLEHINNEISSLRNPYKHVFFQIVFAMNQYFESLILSLETCNIVAAKLIFRSLVESFINIAYIMKEDSQKRSAIFILDDYKIQRININTIKGLLKNESSETKIFSRLSTIEKCDKQLERIENDKKDKLDILKNDFGIEIEESELKIPSIEVRANKAGVKDIYNILYRQLCWPTHLDSSGLKDLIKGDDNKYIIPPIDIEEESNKIIAVSYIIYLKTIEDLLKEFDLYVEEDFKAMEDTSKIINM